MNRGTKSKACIIISIFMLGMACTNAAGRIIYVNNDGSADFNTIQAAIDDSNDGDTIYVHPGLYGEAINFLGKNIVLTSSNPTDSNTVNSTIIGGEYENEVTVTFLGTEDPNCTLAGFNINGFIIGYEIIYDSNGFPIPSSLQHTHATISNCLLKGNYGNCGTVIMCCDGTISNCVIVDNKDPHCIYPPEFPPFAISSCHGLIKNCTIANNTLGLGIEVFNGETTIQNCVLSNADIITLGIGSKVNIMYSDVKCGIYGNVNLGPGNIDTDPCFVREGYWEYYEQDWIYFEGDYHLKSQAGRWDANEGRWTKDEVTSPCIDAGNPGCPLGDEPVPNGNRRNMGAYGGTAVASKSPINWRNIADLTNDWAVDYNDLKVFVDYWLETGECIPGDLNRNQSTNFADFSLMANNWHRSRTGKSVFDFAVATKGPLHITGNIEPEGVNISIESDVYIVSENSNLALGMIGNSRITGDVFITNPDATVVLQGGLCSIGGETGEAALDHVHTGVDPIAFPVPNPSYFEHYVVEDINLAETTFTNVRVPPNTNPIFGGGVTMYGVVFIETPNVVIFSGNVNITGIIVGDGDVTDDSGTNRIDFMGTVNSASVSNLPAEFGDFREETGTFLMAPGFSVTFGGNVYTINGAIAANGIEFCGNAGGTIEGSVLNYSDTPMELSGNSDLYFNRFADIKMPAGFE